MIKTVHITPHMSGGLAAVLLSTLKYAERFTPNVDHEIVTLDNLDAETKKLFNDFGEKLHINKSYDFIATKISSVDIVQLEYWNHPLIYRFLHLFKFPPARILVCCHVSGFYRPQIITKNVVDFADIFLAVTKATENHELFHGALGGSLRKKLRFMRFPVDVDRFDKARINNKKQFNVGYIGTVGYSKLHRSFLKMCTSVKIPEVKFIICGADNSDNIELEFQEHNSKIFEFLGFQKNISPVLQKLDIFGYPLKASHFGSGEQAILEAMYYGIPIVAFSNPAESEIIEHNVTGILVSSEEEYVKAIEYLYQNPKERERIGKNAEKFIETQIHPRKSFPALEAIYRELMLIPKKTKTFVNIQDAIRIEGPEDPYLGAKLFIESLGNKGSEFLESFLNFGHTDTKDAHEKIANIELSMRTRTKGSVNQYLYFFPDDPFLKLWVELTNMRVQSSDD